MEKVIAHRTSDIFATTAKKPGKVISKTPSSIVIEHDDGTTTAVELGRRYGKSVGSVYPHDVISDLNEGDTVPVGRVIAWDAKYFEKDRLDPNSVSWKAGTMAKVAIMDGADTFEDSSALSEEFAKRMGTEVTYHRNLIVDFNQRVLGLVKEGQSVDTDGILCTIQDAATAGADLFDDEEAARMLQMLQDATPKAKHKGVIEKIEVIYNGNIEDMDESLQNIAMLSDRRMTKLATLLGRPKITGKVDGNYRIDGKKLLKNQLAIVVSITKNMAAGVGDKFVFAHQLKSVTCRVMGGVNRTESGIPLDALFSWQSISNRIVNSPTDIGVVSTIQIEGGYQAVKIYEEQNDE